MKILWVINIIPPFVAEKIGCDKVPVGGWILSMAKEVIKNNIDLALATVGETKKLLKMKDDKYTYYLIPGKIGDKNISIKTKEFWENLIKEYEPDLIHLHGTEFEFALPVLNLKAKYNYKVITSIQGLVHEIARYYYGYIPINQLLVNITIRDIMKGTIFQEKKKYEKRGNTEIKMLLKSDIVIGRTDWDKAICKKIGVNKYLKCGENLRGFFYLNRWNWVNCEKHTIFFSQATYPIKGFHIFLEALKIVHDIYPDVKVKVAGYNIMDDSNIKQRIKHNGYSRFLRKKIKKYNLIDCIEFLGLLSENQMGNEYLKANCFVQASVLENSPNSLGEAMLLGVPCIASFVGGTSSVINNDKSVKLYPVNDYNTLALYILQIFELESKVQYMGELAHNDALLFYNRNINTKKLLEIYNSFSNGG